MVKLLPMIRPRKLVVLLVHVPDSQLENDVIAAAISFRYLKTKADNQRLIFDTVDVRTVLLADRYLTAEIIKTRERTIADLQHRVYDLVRITGSGLMTPYLRNIVYSANYSNIPIEATLPLKSVLSRYTTWFPVSRVQLPY